MSVTGQAQPVKANPQAGGCLAGSEANSSGTNKIGYSHFDMANKPAVADK